MNSLMVDAQATLARATLSRDPDLMLYAAGLAQEVGLESEAIQPVRNLLRDHPNNPQLWLTLGLLHRRAEDSGAAVEALNRAIQLHPRSPVIAATLAFVSFEAGLPAAHLFQKAQRLAPEDHSILLLRSAALATSGQVSEAIKILQFELRRTPSWLEGHARVARLRWANGMRDRFAETFEAAVKRLPKSIELWRAYLGAHIDAELYTEALGLISRARAAAGDHPSFDATEAICRSQLGEVTHAEALFRRLLPTADLGVTEHYARHLFTQGRVSEAVAICEAQMERSPSNRLWPLLSVGWRLLGNPHWEWLEGDPRFIKVVDLADKLTSVDALAGCLRTLHGSSGQPLDQSLRGGTQTDGQLFPRLEPEIQNLKAVIVQAVEDYVGQLPPPRPGHPLLVDRRSPIRFSGSWSVRLSAGGSHVDHFHPAGWISSAFYVSLPEGMNEGKEEAGCLVLGEAAGLGANVAPIQVVQPKVGRLVLFPSTMWHGTRPFESGERLTVAFDVQRPH